MRHFGSRLESFYFANLQAQSVLSEAEMDAIFLIAGADASALNEQALVKIKERQAKEKEHIEKKMKSEVLQNVESERLIYEALYANK